MSTAPTITSVTIEEATQGIASKFGCYVQNKSSLSVIIYADPPSEGNNVRLSYYTLDISDGQSFHERTQPIITGPIAQSGTVSLFLKAYDNNARHGDAQRSITVVPYSSPVISLFKAYRANSSGNEAEEGTYLKAEFAFDISPVNNLNDKSYSIEYRERLSSSWTTLVSGSLYSADTSALSSSAVLDVNKVYEVRLTVSDYFETIEATATVPSAFVLMDFNSTGKGMGLGKVSEIDRLEIAMDADFTGITRLFARENANVETDFLRFVRKDGTALAYLNQYNNGESLILKMFSSQANTGSVEIDKYGAVSVTAKPKFMDWGIITDVKAIGKTQSFNHSFTNAPIVIVTPLQSYANSITYNVMIAANVTGVTTTEFTVKTWDVKGNSDFGSDIMWLAIGI